MPAELVNSWMADETLVDGSLWPHRRLEMWLQLRTLNGIDLPSILRGSAHAYVVVQTLMYEREWEALEPLVRKLLAPFPSVSAQLGSYGLVRRTDDFHDPADAELAPMSDFESVVRQK